MWGRLMGYNEIGMAALEMVGTETQGWAVTKRKLSWESQTNCEVFSQLFNFRCFYFDNDYGVFRGLKA